MKLKTISTIIVLTGFSLSGFAQTTVFSDNFGNGSTLNGASTPGGTPLASSTSYDLASGKSTTASTIAANDFKFTMAGTSSGFTEAQALFSSTPISLLTVGDWIDVSMVFTNTAGILSGVNATANTTLNLGLFNSGGLAPVAGNLNNAGLNATAGSSFATGNTANWLGYSGKIVKGSGTAGIITRPLQNGAGTASANQDLLFNNAGGGAYNNPVGANVGTVSSSSTTLTAGSTYTLDFRITLTGANTLSISNALFSGVGTGGASVFSEVAIASGATYLTNSFDGLALGWRYAGVSGDPATVMDISQITVNDLIQPVPEPSTFALAGLGALGFAWTHRRQRR
jgi:hypothetical protein